MAAATPTMVKPNGLPSLIPSSTTYQHYIYRSKTNNFRSHYAAVLVPYAINPTAADAAAAAAAAPADVARLIYATLQEDVPTTLLQ